LQEAHWKALLQMFEQQASSVRQAWPLSLHVAHREELLQMSEQQAPLV
jgi:hypothetical protein